MGYGGLYSPPGCSGCVQHMPEPGLRVDVIGFLSPINSLSHSIIAVTDSGGSLAKGALELPLLWSSAEEDFLRMVTHSFQTSSFKTPC